MAREDAKTSFLIWEYIAKEVNNLYPDKAVKIKHPDAITGSISMPSKIDITFCGAVVDQATVDAVKKIDKNTK